MVVLALVGNLRTIQTLGGAWWAWLLAPHWLGANRMAVVAHRIGADSRSRPHVDARANGYTRSYRDADSRCSPEPTASPALPRRRQPLPPPRRRQGQRLHPSYRDADSRSRPHADAKANGYTRSYRDAYPHTSKDLYRHD